MALLTADDVLNKKFQPTKFREGYDQDEVDDFLDEIVNTLRVVYGENEELKAKLEAAERRANEAGEAGEAGPVAEQPAPEQEERYAAPAVAPAAPAAAAASEPESATGMLALAQRLHDEYVRNGQEEGERIIAEARNEGARIVREAEDQHNRTLTQLEQERSLLERKIDELRSFERDYRGRLKNYLESLLDTVEGRGEPAQANPL